jgi:urease
VHFICPDICEEVSVPLRTPRPGADLYSSQALATGITSVIGGGTGPSAGTSATTCTPGKDQLRAMLRATDGVPLNFCFTGKGNDSGVPGIVDQIEAGCAGLKLHEDWGTSPAVIDK